MVNLTKDLAEVVQLRDLVKDETFSVTYNGSHDAAVYLQGCIAMIRTHHAEIAKNVEAAKRLAALEQAIKEVEPACAIYEIKERAAEIMRERSMPEKAE